MNHCIRFHQSESTTSGITVYFLIVFRDSSIKFQDVFTNMRCGCLSISVVLAAVFAGLFVYRVYLPLLSKIVPEDSLVLPIAYTAFNSISSLGEELGISPRYKTQRYLTEFPETSGFNTDEVETIEDTTIAGVPVRIYRPRNSPGQQQERPGLIYFHGGALVLSKATSMVYTTICSRFANVTQAVVISVEYRRAPEHPFPAQFEDCYAVVMKVLGGFIKIWNYQWQDCYSWG